MTKQEFLATLSRRLIGLPPADLEERLSFYDEMINDYMEEGLSEEEAVSAIGSVEKIAETIVAETPFYKLAREKIKPKRKLSGGEIALIAIGSPIWVSLLVAAIAVLASLIASLWAVIVSFWAVFGAFVSGGIGAVVAGVMSLFGGEGLLGLVALGAGILLVGLSIFTFFGCQMATKGAARLMKKTALTAKKCFVYREEKQ